MLLKAVMELWNYESLLYCLRINHQFFNLAVVETHSLLCLIIDQIFLLHVSVLVRIIYRQDHGFILWIASGG